MRKVFGNDVIGESYEKFSKIASKGGEWFENKVDQLSEKIEELKEKQEDLNREAVIVTFTSAKNGSGKSVIATLLATHLAKYEESIDGGKPKVLLIDLDDLDGKISTIVGKWGTNYTGVYIDIKKFNNGDHLNSVLSCSDLGIDILPSVGEEFSNKVSPDSYLKAIETFRRYYDYILIDTPTNTLNLLAEHIAYPVTDLVIYVSDLSTMGIEEMDNRISEMTYPKLFGGLGIKRDKIGVVLNIGSEKDSFVNLALPFLNYNPLFAVVPKVSLPIDRYGFVKIGEAIQREGLRESLFALSYQVEKARIFKTI